MKRKKKQGFSKQKIVQGWFSKQNRKYISYDYAQV
jgi:hypothetical protein